MTHKPVPPTDTPTDQRDSAAPLLITVNDLGKILNISPRSVWRLLSAGKMLSPIRIGGAVRWRYHEVKRWIDQGCPTPSRTDS